MNRQGIDNTVKRSTDIQLAKNIFSRRISGLRLVLLGFDAGDLERRVAATLFLLEQLKVCFRSGKLILRLLHFARRGCTVLLQTLQGFEIALYRVALRARLEHLRLES